MFTGLTECALRQQDFRQHHMRPGQATRIVCLLGQGQELLRQPLRLLQIPASEMQPSQAQ